MIKTVANIDEHNNLICLLCGFARAFNSMEALEFVMQKHFKEEHGFAINHRVDDDGEIPE